MSEDWPLVKLGDHIDLLTGYPFRSAQYVEDADGVRLVRGANVSQGRLTWKDAKRWPKRDVATYHKYQLALGDVVLAMDRPWVEAGLKQATVAARDLPALLVQRVARMRGCNGLHTRFLRYIIGSRGFSNYIEPIVTGVNVPHISAAQIGNFQFRLPPPSVQEKIVATLAGYDELIENNDRRIQLLEEMAEAIYREWFVNFRAPGHEDIELVNSELGQVPASWSVVRIGDMFEVSLGGTPARNKSEYWTGHIPWINSSSLNAIRVIDGVEFISDEALANSATKLWPKASVLIAITGATLGQVSRLELDACANQSVVAVWDSQNEANEFLYSAITNRIGALISHASGSAQQHINKGTVERFRILVPPPELVKRFAKTVAPSFELLGNLLRQNRNLRTTRDLLLPKLLSGALDVSDLDIDTSWLAA